MQSANTTLQSQSSLKEVKHGRDTTSDLASEWSARYRLAVTYIGCSTTSRLHWFFQKSKQWQNIGFFILSLFECIEEQRTFSFENPIMCMLCKGQKTKQALRLEIFSSIAITAQKGNSFLYLHSQPVFFSTKLFFSWDNENNRGMS